MIIIIFIWRGLVESPLLIHLVTTPRLEVGERRLAGPPCGLTRDHTLWAPLARAPTPTRYVFKHGLHTRSLVFLYFLFVSFWVSIIGNDTLTSYSESWISLRHSPCLELFTRTFLIQWDTHVEERERCMCNACDWRSWPCASDADAVNPINSHQFISSCVFSLFPQELPGQSHLRFTETLFL